MEKLPKSSNVWLYQADRELTANEISYLEKELNVFIREWATHGTQLYGAFEVKHNRFLILAVDENKVPTSGCSIDTSVHKMKEIGAKINVDFFNRLNVFISKENEWKKVHISDLKEYPEWTFYNPMIKTLDDLSNSWEIKVKDSPFA